eukprot:6175987-Pleurochrysis_carterae.AAC.3
MLDPGATPCSSARQGSAPTMAAVNAAAANARTGNPSTSRSSSSDGPRLSSSASLRATDSDERTLDIKWSIPVHADRSRPNATAIAPRLAKTTAGVNWNSTPAQMSAHHRSTCSNAYGTSALNAAPVATIAHGRRFCHRNAMMKLIMVMEALQGAQRTSGHEQLAQQSPPSSIFEGCNLWACCAAPAAPGSYARATLAPLRHTTRRTAPHAPYRVRQAREK